MAGREDNPGSHSGSRCGPPSPQGALSPEVPFLAGAGRKCEGHFRRGERGGRWGAGAGPAEARSSPRPHGRALSASRPRPKVRLSCRAPGRRDAVPARLPEDHLRVPAAGGCDSGLPGDPGPRAAGAPGRVTSFLGAGGPTRRCFPLIVTTSAVGVAVSPLYR